MKTTIYTINTSSLKIKAFEGMAKVAAALEFHFGTEADLARLLSVSTMSDLVRCWNENQAKALGAGAQTMKRFESRKIAIRRLFTLAGQLPITPIAKTEAELAEAEAPAADSKKAQVLAMIQRPQGATGPEIMAAMGWQSHTVRGFIAGTVRAKMGLNVVGTREDTGTRYHIAKL